MRKDGREWFRARRWEKGIEEDFVMVAVWDNISYSGLAYILTYLYEYVYDSFLITTSFG